MAQIMPQKRRLPLNNPPQEKAIINDFLTCPHCEYVTKSRDSLKVHLSKYHEELLVKGGEKSPREGGDKWQRSYPYLYAHGYVKCPWFPVPCPTKINPFIARNCKHLNDCPT